MKFAPVSADLLVKLALLAAGVGLAVYLVRRATGAVSEGIGKALTSASDLVTDVADSVIVGTNPVNPANYANRAVTAIGSAVVSDTGPGRNADGSFTVGGWLYDITHADPVRNGPASGQTPIFNPHTEETDYSQLANLGAA